MDKRLDNLKKFKPTWQHGKTRTIRVPVALADKVLSYARTLDSGNVTSSRDTNDSLLAGKLSELLTKVDCKERGYKPNSSSRLIKDLRDLLTTVS